MKLKGWGGYPVHNTNFLVPNNINEIKKMFTKKNIIARGNGRSYGDSAIGAETTICTKNLNKIISLNNDTGELVAQSGVLLENIIKKSLPNGWFPYVTPGSKYVTIGGMVATDVHGKNHHKEGNFGKYINWIEIICEDGSIKKCSKVENSNLFNWSIGGMGLTGIISKVSINLKKVETSWIKKKTLIAKNLDEAIDIFEKNMDYTYSVAWIDTINKGSSSGRSLMYFGEHAKIEDLKKNEKKKKFNIHNKFKIKIPCYFPAWLFNKWLIKVFNTLYFLIGKFKKKKIIEDWDNFFYPLDSIDGWNKLYGKQGFFQFQCVIPINKSREGLKKLLNCINNSDVGSFLSVLKRFGKDFSNFSFPMEGYTLALDFPINENTLKLANELDEITIKLGGRFYLAKDSRINSKNFHISDKRINEFIKFRKENNLDELFNSIQSKRLKI